MIVSGVTYCLLKMWKFISTCFRRCFKRVACFLAGNLYIDTEESMLFTPSDEEEDSFNNLGSESEDNLVDDEIIEDELIL